jgi:hypothetical protein
MNLLNLFRDGWKITWSNKLIVPLGFFFVAFTLISRIEEANPFLCCLFQLSSLFVIILEGVMIFVIFQSSMSNIVSSRNVLTASTPFLGRLILLIIPLGVGYLLIFLSFRIFLAALHLDPSSGLAWSLNFIFISPLVIGLSTFAVCGVVVHGLGILRGTFNGLLIATNNPLQVITIAGIFSLLRLLLLLLEVIPFLEFGTLLDMGSIGDIFTETRSISANNPIAYLIGLAGGMIIAPFELGVYTAAYLRFIKKVRYPGIEHEHPAA